MFAFDQYPALLCLTRLDLTTPETPSSICTAAHRRKQFSMNQRHNNAHAFATSRIEILDEKTFDLFPADSEMALKCSKYETLGDLKFRADGCGTITTKRIFCPCGLCGLEVVPAPPRSPHQRHPSTCTVSRHYTRHT